MIELPLQEAARLRHNLHIFIVLCFTVALLVPYVAAIIDEIRKGGRK